MEMTATEAMEHAAALLKNSRYIDSGESRKEQLHAANAVLTELCFHLDKLHGIPTDLLEAMRNKMNLRGIPEFMPTSAELLLTTAVQQTIDQSENPRPL